MTIRTHESHSNVLEMLDSISIKYVSCKKCIKCCNEGLVYILPSEIDRIQALDVPLIEINGVTFIKRSKEGKCPMLDENNKLCEIYSDRPICCRLFPLDIFHRDGTIKWGIYTYCPNGENTGLIVLKKDEKEIDFEKLTFIVSSIEKILGESSIRRMIQEDSVCKKIEILDKLKNEYIQFKEIGITIENEIAA